MFVAVCSRLWHSSPCRFGVLDCRVSLRSLHDSRVVGFVFRSYLASVGTAVFISVHRMTPRLSWLLLLSVVQGSGDACAHVTPPHLTNWPPQRSPARNAERTAQKYCWRIGQKTKTSAPISVLPSPSNAALSLCGFLRMAPVCSTRSPFVSLPEENSCDGVRSMGRSTLNLVFWEGECTYYGDVVELLANLESWEPCAAARSRPGLNWQLQE